MLASAKDVHVTGPVPGPHSGAVVKHTVAIAVAALSGALLLGSAAPAAAAVPETELRPAQLERGPDVAVPHLEKHTVVDGDVRIPIDAGAVLLFGKSGDDYVVGTANKEYAGRFRVHRYTADGDRTLLLRDLPIYELTLSDDGAHLAYSRFTDSRATRLKVFDATDGDLVASRRVRGFVSVLDVDGGLLVLGGWSPERTFSWDPVADTVAAISDRSGYEADISADRLAVMTKDPYLDGCSVVSTLGAPDERLWRSCRRRVDTFSPTGDRMATIHILSDGIGPSDVWLREDTGEALAHYSARWFGPLDWESDESLLLDTYGRKKAATVRCVVADCERASALRDTPSPKRPVVRPAWRP